MASHLGFIAELVKKDLRCGLFVAPSDPNAHADAICYLLEHPYQAAIIGERGRRAVLEGTIGRMKREDFLFSTKDFVHHHVFGLPFGASVPNDADYYLWIIYVYGAA